MFPHHHKLHLLAIPFPMHGHIIPMLQLSIRFASRGCAITFIVTERFHAFVAQTISLLSYNLYTNQIRLATIPDGLPRDLTVASKEDYRQYLNLALDNLKHSTFHCLQKLSPPPGGILSDVHLGWTQDLANFLKIPRIGLWTASAAELAVYFHILPLVLQGSFVPFKAESEDQTFEISGLPPLHFVDLPGLVLNEDPSDILFTYFVDQVKRIPEANRILLNTFYELDRETIDSLKKQSPNILSLGPLLLQEADDAVNLDRNPDDLSTENSRCLTWLDTQKASSVLYVSFGSVMPVSTGQFLEVALGLEASEQPFLLVARSEGATCVFPEGYEHRLKERARIVSWAPQTRVLAHPAIGGFLTHCGWNSILESMCAGVPMLCRPLGADQPLNCKLVVDQWKVGMKLGGHTKSVVEKHEVEKMVRAILCRERSRELRRRMEEVKEQARMAVRAGGSSFASMELIMEDLA